MLVQIVMMLVNAFLGSSKGSEGGSQVHNFLSQFLWARFGKAAMLGSAVIIATILLGAGLMTVLMDLNQTSHANGGQLLLSTVSAVGSILMLVAIGSIAFAFRKKYWTAPLFEAPHEKAPPEGPSPLNIALAQLVLDFVEERRHQRQTKSDSASTSSSTTETPKKSESQSRADDDGMSFAPQTKTAETYRMQAD